MVRGVSSILTEVLCPIQGLFLGKDTSMCLALLSDMRRLNVADIYSTMFTTVQVAAFGLLALLSLPRRAVAQCSGAATVSCCATVQPASDPCISVVLKLANQSVLLPSTLVGLSCTPTTVENFGSCKQTLAACDSSVQAS
ncbi:hypothetical protein K474DRAFT_1227446 [Panus rudis PR-1116 ss-1]|nr:hypothetical protein K474DRAFT_1227446 [Panus rudis PR-1116 ss-1]